MGKQRSEHTWGFLKLAGQLVLAQDCSLCCLASVIFSSQGLQDEGKLIPILLAVQEGQSLVRNRVGPFQGIKGGSF